MTRLGALWRGSRLSRFLIVGVVTGLAVSLIAPVYAKPIQQGGIRHLVDDHALPFIEADPHPVIEPPAGYRAYLARDWDHYMVVRAEAVAVRADSPTGKDLTFEYGEGGIVTARRPRYPGELSHLFLPSAFHLPDDVARLRAKPVPTVLAPHTPRRRITFRFREEPLPPGAAVGSRAYRGEFETFVFSGIVTGITGKPEGGFTFNPGSEVQSRKIRPGDPGGVSHIIVPPGYSLPPEFIEKPES